jgi:thioredoxin reductase (NADPH)
MEKKVLDYDVVIIGGGASGLTAGIYCGRARLKTALIEKSLVGGLATYTNEIENYPGFPEPLEGTALMQLFEKQAKRLGVEFKLTDVKGLKVGEDGRKIVETFRADYRAKAVIIATGGKPRLTGAKNEEAFLYDKGISFCATCDAAYYTDKVVMMVGSGDAAIEEGMFLTKFARKVIVSVIHDQGILDANKIAQEQAFANPKMEFIWNTMVDEFGGGERLSQVNLKNTKTGAIIEVPVDGCFLFIGYLPNTEIFRGLVTMNERGYIKTNDLMETNLEGVYAVGDVREKCLRQVSTAVGDGAVAAVAAERYLAESEYYHQMLDGDRPSLLYIWEPTNAGCRDLLPAVERLQCQYGSELNVSKIDVYKSAALVEKVCKEVPKTLPAVVMLKNGQPVDTVCEGLSAEVLDSCARRLVNV